MVEKENIFLLKKNNGGKRKYFSFENNGGKNRHS
jgi:hypothetical protein